MHRLRFVRPISISLHGSINHILLIIARGHFYYHPLSDGCHVRWVYPYIIMGMVQPRVGLGYIYTCALLVAPRGICLSMVSYAERVVQSVLGISMCKLRIFDYVSLLAYLI